MAEPASKEHRIGQDQRLKSCRHCGRTFTRTEHLQRHQRIHTQEAPFSCPHCHRRFQRSDVQHRHVAKHCSQRLSGRSDPSSGSTHRARVACDFCHRKKLKCHGNTPCLACEKANRSCTYLRGRPSGTSNGENVRLHASNAQSSLTPNCSVSFSPSSDTTISVIRGQTSENENGHRSYQLVANPGAEDFLRQKSPPRFGQDHDIAISMPVSPVHVRAVSGMDIDSDLQLSVIDPSTPFPNQISSSDPQSFESSHRAADSILQTDNRSNAGPSIPIIADSSAMGSWDIGLFDGMQGFSNSVLSDLFPVDHSLLYPEPLGMHEPLSFSASCDLDVHESANGQGSYTDSAQAALAILEEHSSFSRPTSPQSRQDATRWLLTPPSIRKFDRQVMNCFLSKFMKHVAPTFSSFIGFKIDEGTTSEKILSMAAVGGLFCNTNGGFNVARSMCSDARRILCAQADLEVPERMDHQICMIQTYMSVELFGICSGDKRLYECSEAFHMQLMQVASRCHESHDSFSDSDSKPTWRRLLNDLYLLECYRVVLFQRPPNLYPVLTGALHVLHDSKTRFISSTKGSGNLLQTIKALMTPDGPTIDSIGSSQSLYALSALLSFSWHSLQIKSTSMFEEGLWKRPCIELALNRWLKTYGGYIDDSTMLLFHLSSIVLHTSMVNIHGLVHKFLLPEPIVSVPEAMKEWQNSDHCKIAVLHANLLIQAAEKIAVSQRAKGSMASLSLDSQHPPSMLGEGPHAAICVYLAVLVLWTTEITSEHKNRTTANATLGKGCNILSQFRIRISTVLINTLRRLEENIV